MYSDCGAGLQTQLILSGVGASVTSSSCLACDCQDKDGMEMFKLLPKTDISLCLIKLHK